MPHHLDPVIAGPWVPAVVAVTGPGAVPPYLPGEPAAAARGVAATAGRPHPAMAASGAFAGDRISFRIGRRSAGTVARLARRRTHGRTRALHTWVHRPLRSRGGLVIVLARQPPGDRATTGPAAGSVGHPPARFHRYTAAGVSLRAIQAASLGFPGASIFASRPLSGLRPASASAPAVSGPAVLLQHRLPSPAGPHRRAVAPEPDPVKPIETIVSV